MLALLFLAPVALPVATPAQAGNEDEARREREEQRQQREEQRQQREEAKRQREEAKRQREEAKRQREEERAQREAARQEAQRQKEAQREERAQVRSVREAARSETKSSGSDDSAFSGKRDTAPTQEKTVERDNTNSTSRDGGKEEREVKTITRSEDSGRNTQSDSSKRDNQEDEKRKSAVVNKDDGKKADRKSGDDDGKDNKDDKDDNEDVAITPEEPKEPRTLVEFFKQFSTEKTTPTESRGNDRAVVKSVTVTPSPPVAPSKSAVTSVSKPVAKTAAGNSQPASGGYNGVKISGFDVALQQLGEFRKRQIMVGGLDADSVRKAHDMGFKTISTARTPADKFPVRTLSVPGVMSEQRAQAVLSQALPNARLGPNSIYRLVPAADEGGKSYPAMRSSSEGAAKCAGPHCLAQEVIGWHSSLSACAQSVRIGVIDTSFDMSHPALKGRKFALEDFRSKPMDFKDDWHGTAVLSVLAGDAQSTTPGLVSGAQFVLASAFGADSNGQAAADAMSVLSALSWLDGKADIINMSFSGPRNEEIELAIGAMAARGVIFVAAAGNGGADGTASFPAAYNEVVAVTAVSRDRQIYRHATHGSYVDFAAPGVNVYTALPFGQAGLRTGTSFAAPFVTGLIAAMPAARRGVQTKADLLARISRADLGDPGRDETYGEGLPIAPSSCDEIGGVASLPWSPEAKRLSQPKGAASEDATFTGSISKPASASATSAMGTAFGFAP